MRLGSFTNLRLAEIGTGVPHEMKLFWPPSPMAVYISPIASITPQICSEQATRQSTTTTISERPKMRTRCWDYVFWACHSSRSSDGKGLPARAIAGVRNAEALSVVWQPELFGPLSDSQRSEAEIESPHIVNLICGPSQNSSKAVWLLGTFRPSSIFRVACTMTGGPHR